MSKAKRRTIDIDQLDLDVSNFRLEAADTQEGSIENMLEEQQQKLVNLARDIIENGLSPAESLIVTPDLERTDKYVVCEGNRRITALRLMQNPRLARGTAVEEDFKKLAAEFRDNPITAVQCVILETKDEALLWIDRKHNSLGGRGLVQWGAPATDRRDEYKSGKVRPSRAVLDYLRDQGVLDRALEKNLKRRTTNVDRVFQMPYLRTRLGVIIDRKANTVSFANDDVKGGNALLLAMLQKLASKDFPVKHILDPSSRTEFIDSFAESSTLKHEAHTAAIGQPPLSDLLQSTTGVTGTGIEGISTGQAAKPAAPNQPAKPVRPLPSSLDRNTLALRGRRHDLRIHDPRLNRLYSEARELNPDEFPNTAALLTRVFLELSSEYYLTELKIPIPAKFDQKKHWGDIGLSLELKIGTVLAHLDPSSKDHELLSARQGISSGDHGHSVINLHGYIHNRNADAEGLEIKRLWERWQPYFERLFGALSKP